MRPSRRRAPRLTRGEGGTVLLELALVLPLLLALLLGITTGGQAYASKIAVVEAVREGARYGASRQLGTGPTAVADLEASVKSRVIDAAGGSLTATDICVKFVLPTGAADCGVNDPAGASAEPAIHLVKVSASRGATIQFFFLSTASTLSAGLAARYERDSG